MFSLLRYAAQGHLPRGSMAYSGLGPSTSVVNPENAPQVCLQAGPMEVLVFSHLELPFPVLCQADIKLTRI